MLPKKEVDKVNNDKKDTKKVQYDNSFSGNIDDLLSELVFDYYEKAFTNNKIYFIYSKSLCYIGELHICKNVEIPDNYENDGDNLTDIIMFSYDINKNELNILDYYPERYSLDLSTYDSIRFEEVGKDYIIFTTSEGIYKIDMNNDKVSRLVDGIQLIPNHYLGDLDDNSLIVLNQNESNLIVNKYDRNTMKLINSTKVYKGEAINIDKYNSDTYYTYDDNGLYKNNESIYSFNSKYYPLDLFSSKDYIYFIDQRKYPSPSKLVMKKFDKKTYTLLKDDAVLIEGDDTQYNYRFVGDNSNNEILIVDNNTLYELDEQNDKLNILKKYRSISDIVYFEDYLFIDASTEDNDRALIIYNSINGEEKIINNVYYYYLNKYERKVYVITGDDNYNFKLNNYSFS